MGVDPSELDRQIKNLGLNPNNLSFDDLNKINPMNASQNNTQQNTSKEFTKEIDKNSEFYKKYNKDLESKHITTTFLKNDVNDMKILIDKERVTLISEGSINLVDAQLNELLLSYKSMHNDKIKVVICENCKEYDY